MLDELLKNNKNGSNEILLEKIFADAPAIGSSSISQKLKEKQHDKEIKKFKAKLTRPSSAKGKSPAKSKKSSSARNAKSKKSKGGKSK